CARPIYDGYYSWFAYW
nr:immunoglobulin heavy chain junction region [Mus musculus]